jgi:hypothetical protein
MSLSNSQQLAVLAAAAERLKQAFGEGLEGVPDMLAGVTHPVAPGTTLDDARSALHELERKRAGMLDAFGQSLGETLSAEWRRRQGARGAAQAAQMTSWAALSLMDDAQIERQVAGDRLGVTLRAGCEAELQLLDAYVANLLPASERPEGDRNPLRPDAIGKAIVQAVEAAAAEPAHRKVLLTAVSRGVKGKLGDA